MASRRSGFTPDIAKLIFCWMYLASSWVHSMSDLGHQSVDSRTHCHPMRRQIVFPRVTGGAYETKDIFSMSTPPDVLFANVKWRRQRLDIVLRKNAVSSPTTVSESMDGDMTSIEIVDKSCTYQGHVRGQRSSYVAVSTCGGLSGYIQTDDEILFIQPNSHGNEDVNDDNDAHLMYTCEPQEHLVDTPNVPDTGHQRFRRSSQPTKYVEVQVVVDHTVVKTAGSKSRATDYLLTLMNIANTAYQHKTLGQNIRIAVVRIVFLNKIHQREVFTLRNPGQTISKFCEWSINNRGTHNYDVSMLLTEDDFGHSGYAPVGVMCRRDQNCFAVRDEGFTSGFIIAHEMGHVFGLNHDGQDNSCRGSKYKKSIMSAVVISTFNHYWWSECSKRNLAIALRGLQCLDNSPKAVDNHYRLTASQKLEEDVGLSWSLDYQCRKDFGQEYEFCKSVRDDPCKELVCSKKNTPQSCFTRNGIPLPGTNCGPNKKCFNLKCTKREPSSGSESAVNGTWAAWNSWTACSTGCGVGIKRRSRTCQFPANVVRGFECEGDANAWTTCVDNTCSKFKDTRAEECSKWTKSNGITKWLPYENREDSGKCHQTCKALPSGSIYVKQQNVADGTPCSYMQKSSDICMDGKCIKVGCDGELNSSKTVDTCGVCDGDDSLCKTFSAVYEKKSPSVNRYIKVLRIPAGARHISVLKNSDSFSLLAVKDGRTGAFLVNGNRKYVQFAQIIQKGSMLLYSHGNSTHLEMVISNGPLVNPLDVMVYAGKRYDSLAIQYNFTLPKDDDSFEKTKFKWKFETWSSCSVSCGRGTKQTVYGCYDKDSNGKVEDKFCAALKPVRIDKSQCSQPKCPTVRVSFHWKATDTWTECEAQCGETGTETRIYQCQKMKGNKVIADVQANFCDNIEKDDETRQCSGPSCTFHWETGSWSECSVTCGRGKQYRNVHCGDPDTDEDDAQCTDDPPLTSKRCDTPLCSDSKGPKCKDKFSFCFLFSMLRERCQLQIFRKKCCQTCSKQ